jgi:peptidyl-prolyl cis-trans isomerase SurA
MKKLKTKRNLKYTLNEPFTNMKRIVMLCCSVVTIVGVLFTSPSVMAQGKGVSIDKIIAKVDNYIVLKSELEGMYQQYVSESQPVEKCQLLQNLVVNKVLVAKAEIDSVLVDESEVESQLERRMDYMIRTQFGSEKRLEEAYGKSIENLKAELRKQVKEQLVVQKMQSTITQNIKITPNEVKRFFNNLPHDSIPYFSTEVEVAQIVKTATVSKEQKNEVKAKLNALKERIVAGEDFADLAKAHSEDVGSGQRGGELGWAKRGDMVPEFEATALKLRRNELSQVIETEYGFHLIQLMDRKGDEYLARHILLRPNYSNIDLGDAARYLDSLRTRILLDSITFEKAAKEYSNDKATAPNGGLLADPNTGSTKIFAKDIDPVIYLILDTMQVGSVSKPTDYRTDDGKKAMRIVFYKTKVAPHQANLKDDWQKIYSAALNEKKNKALNSWFDKAKEDVFIEIDEEFQDCKLMQGRK